MSKKLLSEAQVRRFAKLANLSPVNEMYGGNKGDESRSKRDYMEEEAPYGGNKGDESRSKRDYVEEEQKYGGNKGDESRSKRDYMEEEAPYGGNKGDESRSKRDYMQEDAFEDEAAMGADAAEGELDGAEMAGLEDEAGAEGVAVAEDGLDPDTAQRIAGDIISSLGDILGVEIEMDMGEEAPEEIDMDAELEDDGEEVEMSAEEEIMEALKGVNYVRNRKEIVNEVAKRVARRLLKAKKADHELKEALGSNKSKRSARRTRRK